MSNQPQISTSAGLAQFGFAIFYFLYLRCADPWIAIPGGVLLLVTSILMVGSLLRKPPPPER